MNGSVICIFQIHALFQAFLGEKLLSHATPNRHHTISPIKNELSSLRGSIYSILYTKPCSINGDNVYRGINTAVGISNACSRSFRLVPATNVFLRSCTRIRYIRPPIRGGITRCLRSIRTEREREGERERWHRTKSGRLFLSSFLSLLVYSPSDTCLHPNGTRRDIAGFHFAIHSRVALETRGRRGRRRRKRDVEMYGKRSWILRGSALSSSKRPSLNGGGWGHDDYETGYIYIYIRHTSVKHTNER